MRRRLTQSLLPCLLLLATDAQAEAVQCGEVLRLRLTNELQSTYRSSSEYAESFKLCDIGDESSCDSKSWEAGINVILPTAVPTPLGLKGGEASARCRSLYREFCTDGGASGSVETAVATAYSLLNETVALAVVDAWKACVRSNPYPGDLAGCGETQFQAENPARRGVSRARGARLLAAATSRRPLRDVLSSHCVSHNSVLIRTRS